MGALKGDLDFKELVEILDKNGDGVVDFTEFITAAVDKVSILNKENLLAAFKSIDTDNSNMITVDELKNAFDSGREKD